jgi:hypothetical protein
VHKLYDYNYHFPYLFCVSCGAFLFKKRELASGTMHFAQTRTYADEWVVQLMVQFEIKIENFFHLFSKQIIIKGLHRLTLFALRMVRVIEKRLVRVTTLVRGRNESVAQGVSVASYLENITREHQRVDVKKG